MSQRPPMDPGTDEASERQLDRARRQGEAYLDSVRLMIDEVAQTGGMTETGDYVVGYAIEEAEGLHHWEDGELVWQAPDTENAHVEIVVCDRADKRFVPGLDVRVTIVDSDGNEVGTEPHALVWHPMMYHYAHNWTLPGDGTYSLHVEFDAPRFHRHDETNGRRFLEGAKVEFEGVEISTGRD